MVHTQNSLFWWLPQFYTFELTNYNSPKSTDPHPLPTLRNNSSRHMTPIVSNQFPWLQPSSVRVKSPQATFSNHHKQDLSLLAQTSKDKKKKNFHLRSACNYKFHTHPTPQFQGTFLLAAHRRFKENLSVPGATQENLEPIFLHPKSLFPWFISETKR